jgi:hypothetical protein
VHDGYRNLPGGSVRHQRVVRLGQDGRRVVVSDLLRSRGDHEVELLFHLGPDVTALLDGAQAHLTWTGSAGTRHAVLSLPDALRWVAHRGETDPPLGWYSPGFGQRVPSTTLVGLGRLHGTLVLGTDLVFQDVARAPLPGREVHR